MGLVVPQHVGSSRARAQTHIPCIGRRILNHCATREVPIVRVLVGEKEKEKEKGLQTSQSPKVGMVLKTRKPEISGWRCNGGNVLIYWKETLLFSVPSFLSVRSNLFKNRSVSLYSLVPVSAGISAAEL